MNAAGDLRFNAANLAWANVMPLWHRLGRGEGLLFAVNLSLVIASRPSVSQALAQTLVSIAVLTVLYLLNDVFDAHRDLNDPGKNQLFVRFLVAHRRRVAWIMVFEHLAIAALAYPLLGARCAAAVLFVSVVNWAYSGGIKGRAALDVPWVALWGAAYAMVTGLALPLTVFGVVGFMTAIAHVFQITRDRSVDRINHVRTSAVALPWLPTWQMALACAGMGACIAAHLGVWAGVSAALPFLFYRVVPSNQIAWLTAKLYFGVIWILMLSMLHVA